MKLYTRLSHIGFLKNNYAFKFLFIAFFGIHIPLIGLVFCFFFFENSLSTITILTITLVFTLLATFITLYILKNLIKPIEIASKQLADYRENKIITNLPTNFTDEAGSLMNNIQLTIDTKEKLINEKNDLVYLLTHDMKNFAQNPASLAQLIIEEAPSETILTYANLILDSTNNQSHFIATFLDLLKQEDEIFHKVLKVKEVDFKEVVSLVLEQLQTKIENKNIHLNIDNTVATLKINVNKYLLIRVIVNLVDNAIKFSFSGGEIKLKIEQKMDTIEIAISDNGIGFNAAMTKNLFTKFTKLSRKGTANEKSTGIGLYLCKQIIQKSNGTLIAVSDGENLGATFLVTIKVFQ